MTFTSILPPWLKKRTEEETETKIQSKRRQIAGHKDRKKEKDKDGFTLIFLLQQVFVASLSPCVQCAVHRVSCGYQEQKICPSAAKGSSSALFL